MRRRTQWHRGQELNCKERIRRIILICPKCGENNADNFRFCGMCGTLLETRRPTGAPTMITPRIESASAPEPLPALVRENGTRTANEPMPPISGPSMLGLNRPNPHPTSPSLDSFFEPEQPKTGGRRIVLLVALLAALGGSAWWMYTNYLSAAGSQKATAHDEAASADAGSPPAAAPSAKVPEDRGESAGAASQKSADADARPLLEEKAVTPSPGTRPATPPKVAPAPHDKIKIAAKHEPSGASPKASSAPSAADTGDADFRRAEAYLYGRGVPENCDEAMRYLKAASAKSNAKARSAFGTMYATGHCVARDLPTSYAWFKMALQVDPNNQILEKDLTAVWNQMTPPERQMATRMKQ